MLVSRGSQGCAEFQVSKYQRFGGKHCILLQVRYGTAGYLSDSVISIQDIPGSVLLFLRLIIKSKAQIYINIKTTFLKNGVQTISNTPRRSRYA